MRRTVFLGLVAFLSAAAIGLSQQQAEPAQQQTLPAATPTPTADADEQAIRQLEADLLKGEMSGDAEVVANIFADDWVNIIPSGAFGPTKARLLEGAKEHPNQAPPYTATQQDMRVYIFGDTAIAIYVKEYAAKRGKNTAHQDVTDVFTRSNSNDTWKLRLTRTSAHQEPPAADNH
jgi:uncharacterized protein (TIGR02246 family)